MQACAYLESLEAMARIEVLMASLKDLVKMKISEATFASSSKQLRTDVAEYLSRVEGLKLKQSFLSQMLATVIIKYYQIMPYAETVLYYIFGYVICTLYFASMFTSPLEQGDYSNMITVYPIISAYLYLHIATN
jgi:hypothetical protein